MLAREVIYALINRAQGARPALFVEVAAEALRATARTRADVFREFALLVLEFGRHSEISLPAARAIANAIYVPNRDCNSATGLTRLITQT